jgi:prepilin-type N-terminal cleavage/methylation domain-containing protein
MEQHLARRQGFTLIELLVVIAIISIIAGFLVPTLLRGRGEAYKVQCGNNLQQIYTFAMGYSDKKGTRAFPIAPRANAQAHESLNEMIAFDPEGEATPAQVDDKGGFVLEAINSSYAWVAKRTKNTTVNKPLSSDKYVQGYEDADGVHDGHKKGMNVLNTDRSVAFVPESELPEEEMLPAGLTR